MKSTCTFFIFSLCFFCGCTPNSDDDTELVVESGLQSTLIAHEPLIFDPVAFAVDENGYMYVVENRGYPDPAEGGTPSTRMGTVARLTDQNGDGTYDERTDFADDLTYPNGILPWKGGVFVTCAPDIFYLKDTTGDGVADLKQVVLTGFFDTRTAQIRMSHPTLGLDGWIYVTGGLNGGKITSPIHPERAAVEYSSSDGRFNPETFEFQTVAGKSQFGITIDPFGRRFGCSNRHPVMQALIEKEYLNRNPHLLFNETIQNVSKVQADAVVYPISGAVITADYIPSLIGRSHQGTFTAASGTYAFSDEGLGPDHKGNFFVCESAQSMVQRQVVTPDGPTFQSKIAHDGVEFLASKNEWFRPVFVGAGPQTGLYVVDMHRKVIDHPSYVPESMRDQLDFVSGRDMGRIYRIEKEGAARRTLPKFNTDEALIQLLDSPSEWDRATAFRLLLERKPSEITPALVQLTEGSKHPESRAKGLWLLKLIGGLQRETIQNSSADLSSGVREQVVQLVAMSEESDLDAAGILINMAMDTDARVRFLAALELGNFNTPEATLALAKIAAKDGGNAWTRAAVMSGIGDRMSEFLTAFQEQPEIDPIVMAEVMQEMGTMFGNGASKRACSDLLKEIISQGANDWSMAAAAGLAQGIQGRKEFNTSRTNNVLQALIISGERGIGGKDLQDFLVHTSSEVLNKNASTQARKAAINLLGFSSPDIGFANLSKMIADPSESQLHPDIVQALTRQGLEKGGEILIEKQLWSSMTPNIRSLVLSSLISKRDYIPVLYSAIENKVVQTSEVSSSDRQRLMKNKDKDISEKAKDLFEEVEGGSRMQVYESYRKDLTTNGDIKIGKEVFKRTCAVCHSHSGEGGKVGPDLTGVKNQPADALLMHTLMPNYEVYPNYVAVILETKSGDSYAGWIETESENSLTLRTASGAQETVLRSNISTLTNTGRSLMPDGLEQTMTKSEMMDLIAYLKSGS